MLAVVLSMLFPSLAAAGEPVAQQELRRILAHPVAVDAVRVDGALDEEVWRQVPFSSGFLQKEPEQGAPATRAIEVAVLFDRSALYIGARLASDARSDIATVLTRRDKLEGAESFVVSLDTYRDRRTAYSFAVTAAGVRADWYHPEDDEASRDFTFNPVWEARTRVGEHGWTVEMRIPFSQLRFNGGDTQVWGINFQRHVPHRNEDDFWVYVPRERTGWASWFGVLEGLAGPRPHLRLEVVPSVVGTARAAPPEPPPFGASSPFDASAGVDARMGLGPALTLEGTIHPDFAQVEADPAQVNLTAFEPSLEERRPFFSEGSQLLTGKGPEYFSSRRIGAAPSLKPEAAHALKLRSTPILGAAKLTGTLVPGLAVGALGAVTSEAWTRAADSEDGPLRDVKVGPLAGYGVARVQRQLGTEGSVVGFTLTGVGRLIRPGEGPLEKLPQQALAGGGDWNLRFDDNTYALSGYLGASHVAGAPEAMVRLQQTSAHYFQRPDQTYLRVDPEARSLSGYTGALTLARISGAPWRWEAGVSAVSPGFELNDAGRLKRADARTLHGSLKYRQTAPGPLLRRWEATLRADSSWDYGGHWQDASTTLDLVATWPGFWVSDVFLQARPRTLSPTLTRGGPMMATGPDLTVGGGLWGNPEDRVRWSVEGWSLLDTLGGRAAELTGSASLVPVDRLMVSLTPVLLVSTTSRQYVTTLSGGPPETYGKRYVFATTDRVELSAQLRASYFFSPDVSLELFAAPFASRGRYRGFGELMAARSQELRPYTLVSPSLSPAADGEVWVLSGEETLGLGAPDFNVRSFRSSVALRWEWRLGSTLTVVWQQERSLSREQVAPVGPASLVDPFGAPGLHTVAVKLGYWLPVD